MAIDLKTMDYSFGGEPFLEVPSKNTVNTKTMDYGFSGRPFVTNDFPGGGPGPTSILSVASVAQASVNAVAGVTLSTVSAVAGVSNVS